MARGRTNDMKTRIVHTKFWSDGYISSLSRAEKLAFMYLITNEQIGLSGVYELPDNKVMFDTGLNQAEWEEVKRKFSEDNKFRFYKGWVKIVNVDKYQQFSGEKNDTAKQKEIELISKDVLDTLSIPYAYPIRDGKSIADSLNNHKSVISNHKSVISKGHSSIKNLNDKDFEELAKIYDVPLPFVRSKYDDLINYCEAHGKTYKDYFAALRNWVKKDAMDIRKEASGKGRIKFINPS